MQDELIIDMSQIEQDQKGVYSYSMKWSDNPYTFVYSSYDWYEVAEIKQTLEARLDRFLSGKSEIFKTSDINGLKYTRA